MHWARCHGGAVRNRQGRGSRSTSRAARAGVRRRRLGWRRLLLWVYYSAQILFFGAEFTQAYTKRYGSGIQPAEHAVKVTGEDRAQQGMVSDKRLAAKTAQAEGRAPARGGAPRRAGPRPGSRWRLRRFPATPRRGDARAATDRAAGASTRSPVQASWRAPWSAAWGRWRGEGREATGEHIAAVKLDERMRNVEGRIGKLSASNSTWRTKPSTSGSSRSRRRSDTPAPPSAPEATGRPRLARPPGRPRGGTKLNASRDTGVPPVLMVPSMRDARVTL